MLIQLDTGNVSQIVVTMEDPPTYVPVHLISATYGPCPGRRLFNGEITGGSINDPTRIPFSRDVLPVLRHFLGEGVDEGLDEGGGDVLGLKPSVPKAKDDDTISSILDELFYMCWKTTFDKEFTQMS